MVCIPKQELGNEIENLWGKVLVDQIIDDKTCIISGLVFIEVFHDHCFFGLLGTL